MTQALVDSGYDNFAEMSDSKDDSDSSKSSCSDDDLVSDNNSNLEEEEKVEHNFEKRVHIWKTGKNKGKRSVKVIVFMNSLYFYIFQA